MKYGRGMFISLILKCGINQVDKGQISIAKRLTS